MVSEIYFPFFQKKRERKKEIDKREKKESERDRGKHY
jgi:hypothetical protein